MHDQYCPERLVRSYHHIQIKSLEALRYLHSNIVSLYNVCGGVDPVCAQANECAPVSLLLLFVHLWLFQFKMLIKVAHSWSTGFLSLERFDCRRIKTRSIGKFFFFFLKKTKRYGFITALKIGRCRSGDLVEKYLFEQFKLTFKSVFPPLFLQLFVTWKCFSIDNKYFVNAVHLIFQSRPCLLLPGVEIIVLNAPWVLLQKPFNVYLVLAAACQGQMSCYLKQGDKLRVNRSVFFFYLLPKGL